ERREADEVREEDGDQAAFRLRGGGLRDGPVRPDLARRLAQGLVGGRAQSDGDAWTPGPAGSRHRTIRGRPGTYRLTREGRGALGAELRRRNVGVPARRADHAERRGALDAELRARRVLGAAVGTDHASSLKPGMRGEGSLGRAPERSRPARSGLGGPWFRAAAHPTARGGKRGSGANSADVVRGRTNGTVSQSSERPPSCFGVGIRPIGSLGEPNRPNPAVRPGNPAVGPEIWSRWFSHRTIPTRLLCGNPAGLILSPTGSSP